MKLLELAIPFACAKAVGHGSQMLMIQPVVLVGAAACRLVHFKDKQGGRERRRKAAIPILLCRTKRRLVRANKLVHIFNSLCSIFERRAQEFGRKIPLLLHTPTYQVFLYYSLTSNSSPRSI